MVNNGLSERGGERWNGARASAEVGAIDWSNTGCVYRSGVQKSSKTTELQSSMAVIDKGVDALKVWLDNMKLGNPCGIGCDI